MLTCPLLFWTGSYHNLPTSVSATTDYRTARPVIHLSLPPQLSGACSSISEAPMSLSFHHESLVDLSAISAFCLPSLVRNGPGGGRAAIDPVDESLSQPIPILLVGDAAGSVCFLRVHVSSNSDLDDENSPSLGICPVGWFRPDRKSYVRHEDAMQHDPLLGYFIRDRIRWRYPGFTEESARAKIRESVEYSESRFVVQFEVGETGVNPFDAEQGGGREQRRRSGENDVVVYSLARNFLQVWEFPSDVLLGDGLQLRRSLDRSIRDHRRPLSMTEPDLLNGSLFVPGDRLLPNLNFLPSINERFKCMARFVGPSLCEKRLVVCSQDRKFLERDILQVLDFERALAATGAIQKRRKREKLIDVVWKREKSVDEEPAVYYDLVAGAGILGGYSASMHVFAAAGFGYPDSFRIGEGARRGGLVDVFDLRERRKSPVVQVFSALEESPFSSVVRVKASSGFGLLTTTHFGRVQLWDIRMLRQPGRSQSRLDGSTPIGDWSILDGIHHSLPGQLSIDLPSPGWQNPITVVRTPDDLSVIQRFCPNVCFAREFCGGDVDSVIISTSESIQNWSGFEMSHSAVPKIHVLPQTPLVNQLAHVGVLSSSLPPLQTFLSSPVSPTVHGDPFSSPVEDVLFSFLESLSDFHLRTPSGRIRCFRSLLMESRYHQVILSKKFAKIIWNISRVNELDLIKFLIGVKGCIAPTSLLEYYILFFELEMLGRMYLVCRDAECLREVETICELLAQCQERLPQILEARKTTYSWTGCPFVKSLLNALSFADEETRSRVLLESERFSFIASHMTESFESVFRMHLFRRVRRSTPESVLLKGFKRLAKLDPPSGNLVLQHGEELRRIHGETFLMKTDYFRGLFSFGGSTPSVDAVFDVSATFRDVGSLAAYVQYAYCDAFREDDISLSTLLDLARFADFSNDDNLARRVIDSLLDCCRIWHEEGKFKLLLLEHGHLFREIGAEWIQREVLAIWSLILGGEGEVFRVLGQSARLLDEEEDGET